MLTYYLFGGGAFFLILCLFAVIVGLVFAFTKKKVDSWQEEMSKVGFVLEDKLGLTGASPIFAKLGSGNFIGARKAAREFFKRWFTEKDIDDLIVRIIRKGMPQLVAKFSEHRLIISKTIAQVLPTLLDDKEAQKPIEAVIMERATGLTLDNETKAKLAILTTVLSEWGLEQTSMAVMGLATENADLAKMQVQAVVQQLMTEEGRRAAVRKVLRRLVPEFMEKAEDAEYLRGLVAAEPNTSATV